MIGDLAPEPTKQLGFVADIGAQTPGEAFALGFGDTLEDLPWQQATKWSEMYLVDRFYEDTVFPSTDELNSRFGVPGFLEFKDGESVSVHDARMKHEWALQTRLDMERAEQTEGFWNKASLMGGRFLAQAGDPILLGLMLAPQMAGATAGASQAPLTLSQVAKQEAFFNIGLEAVGFTMSQTTDKRVGVTDAILNAAFGTALGVGLDAAGRGIKKAAVSMAAKKVKGLNDASKDVIAMAYADELLTGEIRGDAEARIRMDDNLIRERAARELEMEFTDGQFRIDEDIDQTIDTGLSNEAGDVIPDPIMTDRPVYTLSDMGEGEPRVFFDTLEDLLEADGGVIRVSSLDMKHPSDIHGMREAAQELGLDIEDAVDLFGNDAVRQKLSDEGFDGVVLEDPKTGHLIYGVLSDDQILVPGSWEKSVPIATVNEARMSMQQKQVEIYANEMQRYRQQQQDIVEFQKNQKAQAEKPDPEALARQVEDEPAAVIERQADEIDESLGIKSEEDEADLADLLAKEEADAAEKMGLADLSDDSSVAARNIGECLLGV